MAESLGMHSYGAKLFSAPYDTANPEGADPEGAGFTRVAEVYSISGPSSTSTVTRVTHLNSDGKAHEKVPGFLDGGQITFNVNYHSSAVSGQLALPALIALMPNANDTTPAWGRYAWLVQFPDGGQWYCKGFIQGTPTEIPEDDRATVAVTIEVSGRPIFNEPA